MAVLNLFADLPSHAAEEQFQTLWTRGGARVERIVSHGQASPEGFWYDQPQHEWVLLMQGAARLRFEGQEPVELLPGDYVDIPAHCRHRVEWTTPDELTVWLAIHCASEATGPRAPAPAPQPTPPASPGCAPRTG